MELKPYLTKNQNDLYIKRNFETVKEYDIIQVQVDLLRYFMSEILPQINCKIILFTSQWHLPQIQPDHSTLQILENDKIFLWISQNPIYKKHKKYMAFPYGLLHTSLNKYMKFVKTNNTRILDANAKSQCVFNSPISRHRHLPSNHIRHHSMFDEVIKRLPYIEYLERILQSKFTISTAGDRDDCYRHYECIGLNSVPISNIDYNEIFGENMVYSNDKNMEMFIRGDATPVHHCHVNRDILTLEYWIDTINIRIKNLIENKLS
jgi:hypothetical protein